MTRIAEFDNILFKSMTDEPITKASGKYLPTEYKRCNNYHELIFKTREE